MTVSGQNQDRLAAGILAGFDISNLVTDHERSLQVNVQVSTGLKQQSGLTLSTIAFFTKLPLSFFRVMRTHIKSIYTCPCSRQLLAEYVHAVESHRRG